MTVAANSPFMTGLKYSTAVLSISVVVTVSGPGLCNTLRPSSHVMLMDLGVMLAIDVRAAGVKKMTMMSL